MPVHLGPKHIPVHVAEAGAKGGYAFRFSTGPDGIIWFAQKTEKSDVWGNRQVMIYNKTLEVAKREKRFWWQVWGIAPDTCTGQI